MKQNVKVLEPDLACGTTSLSNAKESKKGQSCQGWPEPTVLWVFVAFMYRVTIHCCILEVQGFSLYCLGQRVFYNWMGTPEKISCIELVLAHRLVKKTN